MAKNNNLTDFLTGVADAIRRKRGITGKINPQNFEEEIFGIPTEKPEQEKNITITKNGTTIILPDNGKTLSKITIIVNVSGGGSGYTAYFNNGIYISDTVTVSIEYVDGEIETITSTSGDISGKSRSNVVKMTFTDTDSERFVTYRMPADGPEETLYLMPTAELVLTADVDILSIEK